MSTSRTRPLRIAAIGLGEQMKNALHLFFQGPCKNACVIAPEESAEVNIVDLDAYNGTKHLEDHFQKFPQRPVIVLSLQEKVLDGAIFLRKPFKPSQLFDAIREAKKRFQLEVSKTVQSSKTRETQEEVTKKLSTENETPSDTKQQNTKIKQSAPSTHRAAMYLDERSAKTYIGSAPDIDPEDQQQADNAQYDPELFFQSYLKKAITTSQSKRCNVFIECPQGSVLVSPSSTKVLINISEQKLRTLSTVPVIDGTLSMSSLSRDHQVTDTQDSREIDSESLIWRTALWASRGRVPKGASFTTPVSLRRWPNVTKLMVFPQALRVAALWAKEPYSLVDTAKYLAIPQRNVFAFYSAAYAIGLVSMAQGDKSRHIDSAASMTKGRKGLLSRIINRLRLQ